MTVDSDLWQHPRDARPEARRDASRDAGGDAPVDRPLPAELPADHGRDRLADRPIVDQVKPADQSINPAMKRKWIQPGLAVNPGAWSATQIAYHAAKKLVFLYGGFSNTNGVWSSQTWKYDGSIWTQICDPCPPGPREGHVLVYDSARQTLVLFGGRGKTTVHNDLWELGPTGTQWQLRPLTTCPSPRIFAAAAFDAKRGRTVVFGGDTVSTLLDEVWEYDGQKWIGPLTPTTRPSARAGSGAAFAPASAQAPALRDKIVVYGGEAAAVLDDTWTWDGTSWKTVCTACTGTARVSAPLGYDPATGRLVLVGGWTGSDEIAGTSEYATTWALMSPLPGKRDTATLTFDAGRNVFVLFGGNGDACGGDCDQTWEYIP